MSTTGTGTDSSDIEILGKTLINIVNGSVIIACGTLTEGQQ